MTPGGRDYALMPCRRWCNAPWKVEELTASVKGGLRSLWGALLVILLLSATTLSAAPLTAPEHEQLLAQKQVLLRRMLQSPSNAEVILAYVKVAAQVGDNEAAASALERLLLFKPNMPQLELELGAVYFRMGSFELARSYLEKAKADNPPPDLQPWIERYLSEIPRLERAQRVSANVGAQLNPIVPASATRDRITGPCDDRTQLNVIFLHGTELTVTGLNGVSETTKTPGFCHLGPVRWRVALTALCTTAGGHGGVPTRAQWRGRPQWRCRRGADR
jgi:hypothetical protein